MHNLWNVTGIVSLQGRSCPENGCYTSPVTATANSTTTISVPPGFVSPLPSWLPLVLVIVAVIAVFVAAEWGRPRKDFRLPQFRVGHTYRFELPDGTYPAFRVMGTRLHDIEVPDPENPGQTKKVKMLYYVGELVS